MTDIFGTPEKIRLKEILFQLGIGALQKEGYRVERIPGSGKSSVRRITKAGKSRTVSIRTSQDTWIAFPRNHQDNGWITLSDVDVVLAVSVDDYHDPKSALVHFIEADEMRERFDRAYAARRAAGRKIPLGRGVWVSLYDDDKTEPLNHVGGGAGNAHPPIYSIPLEAGQLDEPANPKKNNDETLSIPDAKRRLAMTLGVDESKIKIMVEA